MILLIRFLSSTKNIYCNPLKACGVFHLKLGVVCHWLRQSKSRLTLKLRCSGNASATPIFLEQTTRRKMPKLEPVSKYVNYLTLYANTNEHRDFTNKISLLSRSSNTAILTFIYNILITSINDFQFQSRSIRIA